MGLPHLVAALSGSRAYRGQLVSHAPSYHNAADNRPVDRQHVRNVLAYCRAADDDAELAGVERRDMLAALMP